MRKSIEWYKNRWKERRVGLGYIFCIGPGVSMFILLLFRMKIETWSGLIALMAMHFFGLYLVLRYHLFAIDDVLVSNDVEVKE